MDDDAKLKEGETCGDDDTFVDLVALSYIEDFVRGVSAENLGSKFGGYGSFLPKYQRSPLPQTSSPPKGMAQKLPAVAVSSTPQSNGPMVPFSGDLKEIRSTTNTKKEEACRDDTAFVDPDVMLSYIDKKVQDVLGHFQEEFKGGVSAENLGSKFGGYGSFLPKYQRSPLPQTRSPPKGMAQKLPAVAVSSTPQSNGPMVPFSGDLKEIRSTTDTRKGVACRDDTAFVDPDVTLSYIEKKVQDVLGHFQEEFTGGVSVENLGSKFGGYGLFLPKYQRSPLPQTRSPPKGMAQKLPAVAVSSTRQSNGHMVPFSGDLKEIRSTTDTKKEVACRDDTAFVDPDVTLSYIDKKVQDVLGHFQEEFKGGVSAENLGSKFGGYGSFLPTYVRALSSSLN